MCLSRSQVEVQVRRKVLVVSSALVKSLKGVVICIVVRVEASKCRLQSLDYDGDLRLLNIEVNDTDLLIRVILSVVDCCND